MLSGIMWLVTRRRPLVFFGLPGAFLLSAGLAWGARVVYLYLKTHALAVGSTIIGVSLCIGGALILCTGAILYSIQELVMALAQTEEGLAYGSQAAGGTSRSLTQSWPLFLFALPGAFLLLGGVAVGARLVNIYVQNRLFSTGYALLTTLLSITGSLWLIAGLILHSIRQFVPRA